MIELDTWCQRDCTLGRLKYGSFQCFTLELPWQDNQTSISCIPDGVYGASRYDSPKHGAVLLLESVPGRSWIEIHAGNYTRQIEGCILVGDSIRFLDGDTIPDVANSKATLGRLLAAMPQTSLSIKISRTGHYDAPTPSR